MKKFTKLKFKDDDFEMDINVSTVDNSVWRCQKELTAFYEKSRSTITEHIKNIYDDKLLPISTCRYFRQVKEENETIVNFDNDSVSEDSSVPDQF